MDYHKGMTDVQKRTIRMIAVKHHADEGDEGEDEMALCAKNHHGVRDIFGRSYLFLISDNIANRGTSYSVTLYR